LTTLSSPYNLMSINKMTRIPENNI